MRLALLASLLLSTAASAVTITPRTDGMDVTNGSQLMRVQALSAGALRVRIAPTGTLAEDASWAVPAAARAATGAVTATASGFTTGQLSVAVNATTGGLTISDTAGHVLMADAAAPVAISGSAFTLTKAIPGGAHYFGLGDKIGPLDRRRQAFTLWNTDAAVNRGQDPIYKSIPFVTQVTNDGAAVGLLLDNSWQQSWNFGKGQPVLTFGAANGPIDYYVIAGPTAKDVLTHYGALTGYAPLPPLWAFGYHQSRYSYQSTSEVTTLVNHFRTDGIPLDAVWLDIDYQVSYRPFTVDTTKFADMAGLVTTLGNQNVRLVAVTDLHIANVASGYAPYTSGAAGDHFVKASGGTVYTGNVWPSQAATGAASSVFPEFTRAATRTWWGSLYSTFVGYGIAGFWNDMNEPSVFNGPGNTMPLTNVHRIDTDFAARTATHAEIHNVYGMENSRATYEGLLTLRPTERPFVLTRASYAGGQRYAFTWTGDNHSTYDSMGLTVPMLLNLGMSGFAYAGADIPGFHDAPTAEMNTKWMELGAFQPFMRNHKNTGQPYVEPWVDGAGHELIRKKYINQRYRLLPYLYTLADENSRNGLPIMRPVFMTYPEVLTNGCDYSTKFLVGDKLLVAPSPGGSDSYDICLPSGGWFDYWTGLRVGQRLREKPQLDRLPVYVRAGSIIPRQPVVQSTSIAPTGSLELKVYPGPNCTGSLYSDDGHTFNFKTGAYLRQSFTCTAAAHSVTVTFGSRAGSYTPWWTGMSVVIHGWTGKATATLNGAAQTVTQDYGAGTVTVAIPDQSSAGSLVISN